MGKGYVYSTHTTNIEYVQYNKPVDENIVPEVVRRVLVRGGANVPNKVLVTPSGVVTEVSDDDAVFLLANDAFQRDMKNGFVRMEGHEYPVETVINDMTPADGCAPLTEADYQPGGRQYKGEDTAKIHSVGRAA